eukprot:GHVH01006292.1.p1 GENE.GHVH01006292.1~~GHVH01006292.1.p1  ORF type:complete len:175 (+),score=36.09 GHVH01006292.1:22-525(+)
MGNAKRTASHATRKVARKTKRDEAKVNKAKANLDQRKRISALKAEPQKKFTKDSKLNANKQRVDSKNAKFGDQKEEESGLPRPTLDQYLKNFNAEDDNLSVNPAFDDSVTSDSEVMMRDHRLMGDENSESDSESSSNEVDEDPCEIDDWFRTPCSPDESGESGDWEE